MAPVAVARRIDHIKQVSGITSREIAQLLETTPQTVSRWKAGFSTPQRAKRDRLLTLEWLVDQLGQVYEPDEARLWLFSPHAQLQGERPVDLIVKGRTDEVLALIDQLQSAAFV
ncbi:MAG: antitoxin Xre/MbcA/ParS toxin-binding domain-containing protein [Gemmatimonadota bacterium]